MDELQKVKVGMDDNFPSNTQSRQTMALKFECDQCHDDGVYIKDSITYFCPCSYKGKKECPACHGFGLVHPSFPSGKPDFNKIVPCFCFANPQDATPYAKMVFTFEAFEPVKGTEKALEYAKEIITPESTFVWLLIYGGAGNGKTHLCKAIFNEVYNRGLDVGYYLSAEMFAMLRRGIGDKTIEDKILNLKQVDFLIIDDMGVEFGSEWEESKLDEILTARFAAYKPTIITTNKDFNDLPVRIRSRFDDRSLSRIALNKAGDFRATKKAKRHRREQKDEMPERIK